VARGELRDLADRGIVAQVGSHRWTRYELATQPRRRRGSIRRGGPRRADRREQILAELADGPLSRSELELRTGLSAAAVRRWLTIMRREGSIAATEGSVRSPNVVYRRVDDSASGG
jgi:predicted Rossmann fold nucleotide-binding protein DprA/Smf involved in DNA uptake